MSPRQPPPVPPKKPNGPRMRLQVYLEPEDYAVIERRAREAEWSISREGEALIMRGLKVADAPAPPTPLEERAEAIAAEMQIPVAVAMQIARKEAARVEE